MDWAFSNWAQVCEALLALYGLVAIVVKLTPTKKDDEILATLQPALDKLEAVTKKVEVASNPSSNDNGQVD